MILCPGEGIRRRGGGHTHVNELRHIPLLDGAAAPLLVQSAISPGLGNLPTFTVASCDHQSDANPMRITDLAKWTVEYNPKTWPADDDSGAGGLVWKAQVPSILNYFGMGGLTNGDVLDLGRRMSTTPSLFIKYWNYFTKGHPYVVGLCLKEPCPREEICVVRTIPVPMPKMTVVLMVIHFPLLPLLKILLAVPLGNPARPAISLAIY